MELHLQAAPFYSPSSFASSASHLILPTLEITSPIHQQDEVHNHPDGLLGSKRHSSDHTAARA